MAEVASSVCAPMLEVLGARGIDTDALVAGLSFDVPSLREFRRRIPWSDFASLLERIGRVLGGPGELEGLGLEYVRVRHPGLDRALAAFFASARPLYFLGAQWIGPTLFLSTKASCENLPDGRIRQTIEILTPFRDCPEFFHLMHGALRVVPEELGQERAAVELELSPRRGVYLIQPPERISLRARLRNLWRAGRALPAAIAELASVQGQLQEARASLANVRDELDSRSHELRALHELSQELTSLTEVDALARAAVAGLMKHFRAAGAAISVAAWLDGPGFRELAAAGDRSRAPSGVFPLRVSGREVGRVDLFGHEPNPDRAELLEDALSAFALALDRVLGLQALAQQGAELRQAQASREQAEQQLHRAQRLEAVGRLAGGIAHDLNNVLTAIGGYADLARQELPAGHPAQADLEAISREGGRASSLIKQVLTFSQRQIGVAERLDLNAAVRELLPMLRQLLPDNVALESELDKELGPVLADPAQIEQVLINLVLNARDALPAGGHIRITTRNEFPAAPRGGRQAGRILLCVADDGTGMDAATAARAFEPFFTTKPPGKGSGLGLATVLGMVSQGGGEIDLRTEPGAGTTLSIWLPRATRAAGAPAAVDASPEAPGGSETVLVVEDDPHVRSVIRRMLERKGYRVLEAASGDEALHTCDSFRGRIDVLISDVVMPGADGRELARALQRRRSELLGTILISGHANDDVGPREDATGLTWLRKPFAPAALLQALRRVIDSR